ncbi:MAG: SDR family oxidoreductase [Candidatus Krumholzibacteria bacterium]|nr:SDR family oxidoreductase [Candidatus Krumholzibacteria bacterium]
MSHPPIKKSLLLSLSKREYHYAQDLPSKPDPSIGKVLVTGASGYIGGRLIPELLSRGYRVRIMVRGETPAYRELWPSVEVVSADALNVFDLRKALDGIDTAYYLIHSLLLGKREFEAADIQAAINFREAAEEKGVRRIIYLGGLGDTSKKLSSHLRNRMRVAEELRQGSVPVTILRAAIIIGSGSASYEIIKYVVKRLPLVPVPKWALNRCQPIAVRDVVKYLVGVLETPQTAGRSFDIGGADVLSYEDMLRTLAEVLHRKRFFIRTPISHIGFYSYNASFLTPIPAAITNSLMEGIKNEVICQDDSIKDYLPFEPLNYREALIGALTREEQDNVRTSWFSAYPPAHELSIKLHELDPGPQYTAHYSILSRKESWRLFTSVCKIGGKEGWFTHNWMWWLRGWMDRALLGVGTSRGRRSQSTLKPSDVIDFWRIEELKQDMRLLLRAEMKLPGKAWLEFNIKPEDGGNRLSIIAYYFTESLFGRIYWYIFLPFHHFIFSDLIKQIEKRS